MTPQEQRLDMNVHPALKRLIVDRAEQQGKTLNEVVTDVLCQGLGVDAKDYTVPRRPPGRKTGPRPKAKKTRRPQA